MRDHHVRLRCNSQETNEWNVVTTHERLRHLALVRVGGEVWRVECVIPYVMCECELGACVCMRPSIL